MTIEQYSFKPAVPVHTRTPEAFRELLRTLKLENQQRKVELFPGSYDLTPYGVHDMDHPKFLLDVNNDGTGVLTMAAGSEAKYNLPGETDMLAILYRRDDGQAEIHEVLAYVPDMKPRTLTPEKTSILTHA